MKQIILSSSIALALLSVPAIAGDAAAGKDFYTKKCKACHAEDGAGSPAMQKKYAEKWKALNSKEVKAMKDADLAKAIKASEGHKALVKTITDADVDNVIAYVRTLK